MIFPEFDDTLFPGTINLNDLLNAVVCFKKVVTVPNYLSCPLFRCKMNGNIRTKCFECDGKQLTGSPYFSFRERTLKACNLTDGRPEKQLNTTLVVVSRKPYQRFPTDSEEKFNRVLTNENELLNVLKKNFPKSTIDVVHLEDLPICEQIRHAYKADVMLGVHGAGLVHFWWLKEDALALEMEPSFELGNRTFRMLTTLTGRQYHRVQMSGTSKSVCVKPSEVANYLLENLPSL